MTEGGAIRMKRNGARLFKNPPQPHMCIQDFIQGTTVPCYVNVLSWDRIAMPCTPSQPVPLWGGMKVPSPRTKAEAVVFAVMANPEVLRTSGKNAEDPEKRLTLIELLLDFVEAMNAGVIFTRRYTILKDRDITGELKEVWNAVQARRDREQPPPQQETWIDAQPPVPQYPQYQDQQQQEYAPQPPQYHTSMAYNRGIGGDSMHYENYGYQPQNSVIPQNDHMYQPGQIVSQQYGNVTRIPQERYNYREHGRENLVQNMPQQSCPAYPAPQYQFQQLPRQMVPQYVNSNVHPNTNLGYGPPSNTTVNSSMNTNMAAPYQSYITYQQRLDNAMHVEIRRMHQQQQQQQQQQIHMNHVQPVPQYEPATAFNAPTTSPMNVLRLGRPHMGVAQKNTTSKRQINSPTHSKQVSCVNCQSKTTIDNGAKPKSPVKVLQRESSMTDRQEISNHSSIDNSKVSVEKVPVEELKNIQITDLDEDLRKTEDSSTNIAESSSNKHYNIHVTNSGSTSLSRNTAGSVEDTTQADDKTKQDAKETDISVTRQTTTDQKYAQTKIIVIKGNHKRKENTENNRTFRIRFVPDEKTDRIMKNILKIHPGMSGEETSSKKKTNGQTKDNSKAMCENDEVQQGYTILKKSESSTQEDVINEITQISIQDCKDATEVSPVLS